MSDRDLLIDLAMKTGNLLQHPMQPAARAAARKALIRTNQTLAAAQLNAALDQAASDDTKPGWLPYKDD
jgi:hypothetical protein